MVAVVSLLELVAAVEAGNIHEEEPEAFAGDLGVRDEAAPAIILAPAAL